MGRRRGWSEFQTLMRAEWRHLTTINASDRHWQMPVGAALASGLPLLVGASFDHLDYGLVSSLGGLVFLYLPDTPLSHRTVLLMACAFGMGACYALGVMSHFVPLLLVVVLTGLAIVVTMVCRFYGVSPPGSLFFIMAAAIGAYSPDRRSSKFSFVVSPLRPVADAYYSSQHRQRPRSCTGLVPRVRAVLEC